MGDNRLFEVHPWKLRTEELRQEDMRLLESLTSLGNGYMGLRGNFTEGYSGDSVKGTYLAGVWYPDPTRVGWWKNGYPEYSGKIINAVDFASIRIFVDGTAVDLNQVTFEDFSLELDMKKGVLCRSFVYCNPEAEVKIRFSFRRFLSIVTLQAAFHSVEAQVLQGRAKLEFSSLINGEVRNEDSNFGEMFWEPVAYGTKKEMYLTTRTVQNDFGTPRFTVTALMNNKLLLASPVRSFRTGDEWEVAESFSLEMSAGQRCRLEKSVIVVTSRDVAPEDQLTRGKELLDKICERDFAWHFEQHAQAWLKRWERADVIISGDDQAQQGIRFNIFNLFQTYYGHDERLNIGPKGFTGEKYGGATHWDTEAFILPMYLSIAHPSVARQLLLYRYRHLPQAKENAGKLGLKGALYPMVTLDGRECHNEWEITFEEIHRNGAIAYAIYNYTNYTGDSLYLKNYGIEVLVEISRFWASRVHFSEAKQQFMLHGVTGPNEYENNVNNNWYTNFIARWTLRYTLQCLNDLLDGKKQDLAITSEELARWQEIIENMYLPVDEKRGVFIQHDTFLDKELQTVAVLNPQELPLWQNWSWDRILRSCFVKQADVLQGIYMFPEKFTREAMEANFNFYEPMTVHESSLSPSIHSIIAAWLGLEDRAVELYERTARLDLDNYNNDTEDGLHITSMGGSWLCIAHGFAGMRVVEGVLSFSPFCPKNWKGYQFKVLFRGRLLEVAITRSDVSVALLEGEPLTVLVRGEALKLRS